MTEFIVHVVEDDKPLQQILTLLFEDVGWQVKLYDSATDFLNNVPTTGCCVFDVRLRGGKSGLRIHDELLSRRSDLPVIFLTGHGDISMAVQAMKKGAFHFLTKPFRNQELIETISECFIRHEATAVGEKLAEVKERFSELTKREREILDYICHGDPNKEIARSLDISIHTVEVHRANILKKMRSRTTAHLVSTVIRAKLIDI